MAGVIHLELHRGNLAEARVLFSEGAHGRRSGVATPAGAELAFRQCAR
jgi:hypothetical protein